jgi:translation initiation factor IF-3
VNRVNEEITAPQVIVVDSEGTRLGVMPLSEAIAVAQKDDLDLVEVGPKDTPPICRVMDFGRFKFKSQRKRKQKSSKKMNKEVKFRPVTDVGDYQVKIKRIIKFLEAGARVQITVRFRGREMMHANLAEDLMTRVIEDIGDLAVIESPPKTEGRQMMMVINSKST